MVNFIWRLPTDDFVTARQIFCCLMSFSGAYRLQCFIESENKESYLEKRGKGNDIDLSAVIKESLEARNGSPVGKPDFSELPPLSLDELLAKTAVANDNALETSRWLHGNSSEGLETMKDEAIERLKFVQSA